MALGRSAPMVTSASPGRGGGDGGGAGRGQGGTGSSATIAKFCSTDSGAAAFTILPVVTRARARGGAPMMALAARCELRGGARQHSRFNNCGEGDSALTELSALTRARGGADSSALLRRPTCTGRLYVAHYNLCRVHEALRSTPAIALGIADRGGRLASIGCHSGRAANNSHFDCAGSAPAISGN